MVSIVAETKTNNMKSELLSRKEGRGSILKMFISASIIFTLTSCTKESLIKPFGTKADKATDPKEINNPPADTLKCGGFRTQTQGGWGAPAHGNNPGNYLHDHFTAAFPNGLTVGCTYKITLTSAQAITDYLPGGGTPAVLTTNYTNPVKFQNNLASQLITLTLSVQFDLYDPKFSSSSLHLGSLLIGSGPFKGMSVNDFLKEANKVLGGCPSNYTAAQISDALTAINENFDDGTANGGFLVCPEDIIVIN